MIAQFNNNLEASTYLWAENKILDKGQAYINYTSKLYYSYDNVLGPNYVTYSAPFKQWVYDSGVAGATIINSVSGSFGTISRGQSGIIFDYDNGRVILPSGAGKTLSLTGTYAIKEINFYRSNTTEEEIISQNKYFLNPRFYSAPVSGVTPYDMMTPAVFVSSLNINNDPFALGGLKESISHFSFIIFAETPYQLNGLFSIFTDQEHKCYPLLDISDDPLNGFNDLKTGYNYNNLITSKGNPGNLIQIDEVIVSKISDAVKLNRDVFAGIVDMKVSFIRTT